MFLSPMNHISYELHGLSGLRSKLHGFVLILNKGCGSWSYDVFDLFHFAEALSIYICANTKTSVYVCVGISVLKVVGMVGLLCCWALVSLTALRPVDLR